MGGLPFRFLALQHAMHSGATDAGADPPAVDSNAARSNKLELIERLADDLAHEIKNPLHSMVINLEVLKRRIGRAGGSPSEDLLRYVGVLDTELDRVNRRVELLLRLVRGGRGSADPTSFDALLEELFQLLELERERRTISVRYEPSGVPVRGHLPLDPARQLVLGLLLEVLALVPSGGELSVRTDVDPPWARLHIEGTGPLPDPGEPDPAGARAELLSRLAVARSLTDSLGGRLEVAATPTPASGVSITLSLPLAA